MGIYLIRPQGTYAAKALDLMAKKIGVEERQEQVKDVIEVYQHDPAQKEIREWVKDAAEQSSLRVLSNLDGSGVTGTTVIDASEEVIERMGRELPKVSILSNQPVELIRPRKAVSSTRRSEVDLSNEDLWHLEKVRLQELRVDGLTGKGVSIAVLDTGIDSTHPALRGKIAQAFEFNSLEWQVIQNDISLDTDGHGTHVAGLICGEKVGVAPEVKLYSGVLLPNGRASLADFVLALEWVSENLLEVQIVNISAGFSGYFEQMQEVMKSLVATGMLPVCAIGNDGRDKTSSPGNYRDVVSVGAMNRKGRVSSFSGGGSISVDHHIYDVPHLVAPGEDVYSSIVQGGYESWAGTSMAAPIVSGVASLLIEKYGNMHVLDLKEELIQRCVSLLGEKPTRQGHGVIQVVGTE